MKHPPRTITIMLTMFFLAQIIGLFVITNYIDAEESEIQGEAVFREVDVSGITIERPDVDQNWSFAYMLIALFIGTSLLLIIIKYKTVILWKLWAYLAVVLCLSIALSAFIDSTIALIISLILGWIKIFKSNFYIHNLTELFLYGGLAAIFVPMLNLQSALILLILISLYDMYAVWKSKHMVDMAKFQMQTKMFSGMIIPHKVSTKQKTKKTLKKKVKRKVTKVKTQVRSAILGGGDVGFPLLFAGTIMKLGGIIDGIIISIFATISLGVLLTKGNENKFYPAMPFLSIGCLAGWIITLLI